MVTISTAQNSLLSRVGTVSWRSTGYWIATIAVAVELGLGGIWDIARIPSVLNLTVHLGYPSYFLVLLGTWKVLGAVALLVPGRPLIKEWAYAGVFFTYTGAIASHLTTGYDVGEVAVLALLTALTVLSWALRPPSRRACACPSSELLLGHRSPPSSRGPDLYMNSVSQKREWDGWPGDRGRARRSARWGRSRTRRITEVRIFGL